MINNTTQISETNPLDTNTIEGWTYTLSCDGLVGDMLYLTDLDYDAEWGHSIAEVEIFGSGEQNVSVRRCGNKEVNSNTLVCTFKYLDLTDLYI